LRCRRPLAVELFKRLPIRETATLMEFADE
jgi:hypothetical protein